MVNVDLAQRPLPADFFKGETVAVAQKLLGTVLCRHTEEGLAAGIIVETEAYLSQGDPACHAARGMTRRNAPMFGIPGTAYVYFIYGNYYCFNVVTAPAGIGEAVLVRALQPFTGEELMLQRRGGVCNYIDLANGPGKLCQALHIDTGLNGHTLREPPLWIAKGEDCSNFNMVTVPRIGISQGQELPLRFYIAENKFVSRRITGEAGNQRKRY